MVGGFLPPPYYIIELLSSGDCATLGIDDDTGFMGDDTEAPDWVPSQAVLTTEVNHTTVTEFNWKGNSMTDITKSLIAEGNDVIFVAVTGSANEIFAATVKYNESKKKSAAEVGVITIEPDQYLTVTPANQKYLLGAVSKRVDNAILDLVTSAVKDQQISDVLNPEIGIYGRSYGISGGNIELTIWSPKLQAFKASIAAASRTAAKL